MQATGERAGKNMKKEVVYTDAPPEIDAALDAAFAAGPVLDFLPPPDQLVMAVEKQKITISLDKSSVDFFKKAAKENGVKYQTMINNLLDSYVRQHS